MHFIRVAIPVLNRLKKYILSVGISFQPICYDCGEREEKEMRFVRRRIVERPGGLGLNRISGDVFAYIIIQIRRDD